MSSASKGGCGCSCDGERVVLVFPCSGASNVGQITNRLALRLTREGRGSMSCLAGVGAHLSGYVVSARDCDQLVVLDGCPQRCAAKIFEHVGIEPDVYLLLTEHGFKKRHGVPVLAKEVQRARQVVLGMMKRQACAAAS